MDVFGKSIVILNSQKAVFDLFSKKGSFLPKKEGALSRPSLKDLRTRDRRQQRRHFHQEFNEVAARRFFPVQTKAVHGLLRQFLESPDGFMAHIKHMAATIILSVAYGLEIQPKDDPLIKLSDDAVTPASAAGRPGAYLVPLKYIPEWFPGAGFKRKARLWRQLAYDMWNVPWDMTKQQIALGIAAPSFVSSCLDTLNHSDSDNKARDEYHIQSAAGSMYAGKKTMGAVGFFLLAMAQFPEAQAKAQAEIDMVLRCNPPGPIGRRTHTAAKDDVYRNYFIPRGAFVVSNLWAITHDPKVYPEPLAFKPERYMGPDGKLDPAVKDPSDIVFGIGRRICPARILGYNNAWISIASILAAFDIKPGPGFAPEKVTMGAGLISFPESFPLSMTPRSMEVASIIRELDSNTSK
ncbi:cytochrome P450 [Hymenopellis radicata]|nr:cytochrome P450 [Hymenopellis radicata]